MPTAQTTSNTATLSRLHEAANSGDAELISKTIDEVFQPDVLIHTPAPSEATGTQALKHVRAVPLRAFPDLHITVQDVTAEEDKVISRNTATRTHQGQYRGLPPTGKTITNNETFILRFPGARIAETWGVIDVFSQMKQLGVIPGGSS